MNGKYAIGDVAKMIGVESHTVRFWSTEMSSEIKPTIGKGGRRYYSNTDIEQLQKIKNLIHTQGYTIGAIKKGLTANEKSSETPENNTTCIVNIKKKIEYLIELYEKSM